MAVIRALAVLFTVFLATFVISAALGFEGLALAMFAAVMLTTAMLVLVPGLMLASQLGSERMGRELRVMGRVSAAMFVVAALVILRAAVNDASLALFLVAAAFAAFGAWLFARSWRLPPAVSEKARRDWPYYIPFGLSVLVALATAFVAFGGSLLPTHRAYLTAMKGDLRNVVSAEEAFRDSTGRFGNLRAIRAAGFRPSMFVYVTVTAESTAFWATATTPELPDEECTIWVGRRPQDPRFVGKEGEPDCRKP